MNVFGLKRSVYFSFHNKIYSIWSLRFFKNGECQKKSALVKISILCEKWAVRSIGKFYRILYILDIWI